MLATEDLVTFQKAIKSSHQSDPLVVGHVRIHKD